MNKAVDFAKKTWKWLNGKKTVLGTFMCTVGGIVELPYKLDQVLVIAGSLLGGTGLIHKGQKGEIKKAGIIIKNAFQKKRM